MTETRASRRGGFAWAIIGGLVLVGGIVAIIVSAMMGQTALDPSESPSSSTLAPNPTPEPSTSMGGDFVDPTAAERGWAAEPITSNPESYIRAALSAAATFDTTKSSREEWLDFLDTWFTPDTRYASEADQQAAMDASRVELRQGVVLPQAEWDSLANENGRVVGTTNGDVTFVPVAEDISGDMLIGTADVALTFTRSSGAGDEASYDETVRVSVQVLCGESSVPTPGTAQKAGDCKIVRYFTEPLES